MKKDLFIKALIVASLIFNFTMVNSQTMNPDYYYLKVVSTNCEVVCLINGLPAYDLTSEDRMVNYVPVNLFLTGKGNQLDIRMKPIGGSGKVEASIYVYQAGDFVDTEDYQPDAPTFVVESDSESGERFSFDNERFDYSQTLKAPPVSDEREVMEYAAFLQKIIAGRDAKAFAAEMKPKIDDFMTSIPNPESIDMAGLEGQFAQMLSHPNLKTTTAKIAATPCADGRIWRLGLEPDHPFIYIPEEDGTIRMDVYVAKVDGSFKIVR